MSESKPSMNTTLSLSQQSTKVAMPVPDAHKSSNVRGEIALQLPFAKGNVVAMAMGPNTNVAVLLPNLIDALMNGESFYGYPGVSVESASAICTDKTSSTILRSQFSSMVESGALEVIESLTDGPSDYFLPEGRSLLQRGIQKPRDALILTLPKMEAKSKLQFKELPALLQYSRARCHTVVMVFQGLTVDDSKRLPDYFHTVFSVEACEPDYGYTSAWIVAPAAGTLLAAIGNRPVIENIGRNKTGQIERNAYECSSPKAMTREIVKLLESGKTYEAIGKKLGVNKTTVLRRVDALPFNPNRRANLDD